MRILTTALLVAACGGSAAGVASAATTVGQSPVPGPNNCAGGAMFLQTHSSSGNPYVFPIDGMVTSMTTQAYAFTGEPLRLLVVRPVPNSGNYSVVGVGDAVTVPSEPPGADVTTPITPFAVKAGDIIGLLLGGTPGNQTHRCFKRLAGDEENVVAFLGSVGGSLPAPGSIVGVQDETGGLLSMAVSVTAAIAPCDLTLLAVGCWPFDEPSGVTAADVSSHGNTGTYVGLPSLGLPGVRNTAVSMDGVNDYVRVLDSASLDVGDTFTLEGWIKRSSTTKSQELFNKGAGGFQLMVMGAANANEVWLRKAGISTIARSSLPVPADGAYHHVVATKNGTGAGSTHIYVDGVEGTIPVTTAQAVANTSPSMSFGGAGSAQANYDEFSIYDGVLTAEQVQARYAAGLSP